MAFWAHASKFVAAIFCFCALVLEFFTLLGNTYNVKFLRWLYFARLTKNETQEFIDFGLWNACFGANNTVTHCNKPQAAFDWTTTEGLEGYVSANLSGYDKVFLASFILYWCGFALTLITLILSITKRFNRMSDTFAGLSTLLSFLVLLAVFCIMAVVSYRVIHSTISTSAISGNVGAATWMTLGAMAGLLVATIYYFLGCWCRARKRNTYDRVV